MKYEIKHRTTGAVLYTAELPDNTPRGLVTRHALENAVGARAYLAGANLDGAYLTGAYLDGEKISKAPLSILNLRWPVLITEGYMRIGCERHTHAEWAAFDEKQIRAMHTDAFDFWVVWRSPLLAMCEKHPAKETA